MAADTNIYIDELINNPANQITIYSPLLPTLFAFVDADTDFGVTATYSSGDWSTAAGEAIKAGYDTSMKPTSSRVSSSAMSKLSWTHSSLSSLTFDLFFVAYEIGHNPLNDAVNVFEYTLPETAPGFAGDYGLEVTPGQYHAGVFDFGTGVNNACSIEIGDWFFSHNSWVMQDAKITISKKKQPDGIKPLYAKVTVTMQPVRDFHANEVKKWFIGTTY